MSASVSPAATDQSQILSFTGERYTPETEGNIYLEHMHRYLMVRDLVSGKDVLDIASGEGFGSYFMAGHAASVVGVDIDQLSVEHASARYRLPNLAFRVGSCDDIPLADNSVDVVVSYETIEHHDAHERMMLEVRRVLRPGGVIVISSPEKHAYTDVPGTRNPYHVKELYRAEFDALMRAHFRHVVLYGQRVVFGSAIFPEGHPGLSKTTDARTLEETEGVAHPLYLIAIASDAALPALPAASLFEEDVLRSEVAGVRFRKREAELEAEREQFRQASAHFEQLAAARQDVIAHLESRLARSLGRRLKKGLRRMIGGQMSSPGHAKEVEVPAALPEPIAERPLEALELAEVAAPTIDLLFPVGHFYSPIADPTDIESRRTAIFRPRDSSPGIDYRIEAQLALLEALQPYVAEIDYPIDDPLDGTSFFYANDQYPVLDADFLFAALRHFQPKNMIEVGSGFSSLITADVNRRFLDRGLHFTCIEPYPRQFLIDGVDGITDLVVSKVEDLDLTVFDRLGEGDILFIDSSHVSKIGSDVNYLFFEVLPRLRSGVIVHIHDIFLPDEYPEEWALHQNRNWNEQYVLQAFLQFNTGWEVIWSAHLMGTKYRRAVQRTFARYPQLGGGGSFWIRRR